MKPALSLIIHSGKHSEPSGSDAEESSESESEQSGELDGLAQDLLDAITEKDVSKIAAAFEAMCQECMSKEE